MNSFHVTLTELLEHIMKLSVLDTVLFLSQLSALVLKIFDPPARLKNVQILPSVSKNPTIGDPLITQSDIFIDKIISITLLPPHLYMYKQPIIGKHPL